MFTRAIVRPPALSFASGLTSAAGGPPDVAKALEQHHRYCDALRSCGLQLTYLEPDPDYPDSTFVEDTAVVAGRGAVLTRPGAPSRRGEVDSVAACLRKFYSHLPLIAAPGTVDGGDVCEADGHFVIGLSARTNEAGANQMAEHLRHMHYRASIVDLRAVPGLLHLKSGIAHLGGGTWMIAEGMRETLQSWRGGAPRELIVVSAAECYAANCVRINDSVLVAQGYPRIEAVLRAKGHRVVPLDMSEFCKMDGGLSCLSLRF